ncbi:hypothetical protein ONS95_003271 [Cadophora gregata]|uniref:uncharacterized protein n=1 Tax=Cadophora gregata TaxID=51156 RepID=UPI0026DC3751|nr:uncharacterized protein ONS95_003271 [Cadophora gregata]KAK0108468.1 hypothetical protein ONS95_003271 [Cadophora gregata]KAK0108941.1 hypothetical protein ONS96_002778 [Cadophora gregata f. sp. sojae]
MDMPTFIAVVTVLSTLLCIFIILSSRLLIVRHRRKQRLTAHEDAAVLQPRIPGTPALVPRNGPPKGWDADSVKYSFAGTNTAVLNFILKWILDNDESIVPGDDSPSRIEGTLFKEGTDDDFFSDGRDTRPFPNQRKCTPEEIYSLLQNETTRSKVAHYIFMSVLLNAVSLDGSPPSSLLPLWYVDLCGLRRLREAIRGVHLSPAVSIHAHQFGAYHGEGKVSSEDVVKGYVLYLESVFKPYLKGDDTREVKADRHTDLRKAIYAAADHGMKVIGCPNYEFQYNWGERDVHNIMIHPGLSASVYVAGRLDRTEDLIKARVAPVVRSV